MRVDRRGCQGADQVAIDAAVQLRSVDGYATRHCCAYARAPRGVDSQFDDIVGRVFGIAAITNGVEGDTMLAAFDASKIDDPKCDALCILAGSDGRW